MAGAQSRDKSLPEPLVRRIEGAKLLDGPANLAANAASSVLSPGALKDAVSGTWLGHALHPALTDVVIGSFLSASLVDLLAGREGQVASERLIMVGIAAYGPTALAGVSDWSDGAGEEKVRRVGIVHAAGNLMALSLYASSLAARRNGDNGKGRLLAAAGATVLLAGGYLGGHLSLRRGIGVDQTVFDPGPGDWSRVAASEEIKDGKPTRVVVDDTPVLLLRSEEELYAVHDRCSHRGCSLADGQIDGHEVVCGCHSSRFDLRDGALLSGPATAPQPAYAVRERDGAVEIKRRAAN